MDILQAIGIRQANIDTATGKSLSHDEIYDRAIEFLGGLDAVKPCIPFTLEELQKAYPKDRHFNTLPLVRWHSAAGFMTEKGNGRKETKTVLHQSRLLDLLGKHGINEAAPSTGTCLLKQAARRWLEETWKED